MKYEILYADPPWYYYGDPNKMAAAGKHYRLMKTEEICALDIKSICSKKAVLFLWTTSSKLDQAIEVIKAWGFHYRGVSHVWVKTRKDGGIIHGMGVRPTVTKPTTELLLVATTNKKGRPFKLLTEKQPQVVLAPRGKHSEKPEIFRDYIEELFGSNRPKIELFARKAPKGWDIWGNEVKSSIQIQTFAETLKQIKNESTSRKC